LNVGFNSNAGRGFNSPVNYRFDYDNDFNTIIRSIRQKAVSNPRRNENFERFNAGGYNYENVRDLNMDVYNGNTFARSGYSNGSNIHGIGFDVEQTKYSPEYSPEFSPEYSPEYSEFSNVYNSTYSGYNIPNSGFYRFSFNPESHNETNSVVRNGYGNNVGVDTSIHGSENIYFTPQFIEYKSYPSNANNNNHNGISELKLLRVNETTPKETVKDKNINCENTLKGGVLDNILKDWVTNDIAENNFEEDFKHMR